MMEDEPKMEGKKTAKFVIIGDGSVGKTCVCNTYANKKFPEDYVPTVFENHNSKHTFDGEEISVSLWDTAGQEELREIRVLSYGSTSVFLVCFSLDRQASLSNLKTTWLPEIQGREPKVPKLLVGTKSDLKNPKTSKITQRDINKLVKDFKLSGYIECSAMTDQESVQAVFEKALEIHFQKEKRESKSIDKQNSKGTNEENNGFCTLL